MPSNILNFSGWIGLQDGGLEVGTIKQYRETESENEVGGNLAYRYLN